MGKNQSASNLTNIIQYNNGNISFVSGSTTLMQISSSGAITITGVISGSTTLSSSFATTASYAVSATSASYSLNSTSASYALNATSASNSTLLANRDVAQFATTASNVYYGNQIVSASVLVSGSITATGQIVAQTINVQSVTSSIVYSSGSNVFGNRISDTQTFTGSMLISGSVNAVGAICTVGTVCAGSVCAPSHIGGTFSGTVVYGSSAICGGVISGSGALLTGALSGTSATFSSSVTATSFISDGGGSEGVMRIERDTVGTSAVIGALNFTNNNGSTTYGRVRGGRNAAGDGYVSLGTGVGDNLYAIEGGNVGIGTTSPSTLLHLSASAGNTVQTIEHASTNGSFTLYKNNSSNLYVGINNSAATLFGGTGGAYAGVIQMDNNYALAFATSGSERMRITNGGNVGIGTTSVPFGLTVYRPSTGQGDTSTNLLLFDTTAYATGVGGGISFGGYYNNTNSEIYTYGYVKGGKENSTNDNFAGYVSFGTRASASGASAERMRIMSGGNVGIGTTDNTAAYRLNVSNNGGSAYIGVTNQSGAAGDRYLRIGFGTGATVASIQGTRVNVADDVNLALQPDGGNVGIGTISPQLNTNSGKFLTVQSSVGSGWLELATSTTTDGLGGALSFNNTNRTGTDKRIAQIAGVKDGANDTGAMSFVTWNAGTGVERMRISCNGAVYINSSSNQLANATPALGILAGTTCDAVNIKHVQNGNNSVNIWQTGTSAFGAIVFYKGNTQDERGNITVSTTGTSFNSVSDYRLKENVIPSTCGLDRLMQLKPSKFNWIQTGEEAEGFIAHELQEVFPYAVTGEKDGVYSSTGNIKPQSVDYGRITPLLVKAIQEQQCQIKTLESCLGIA